MLAKALALLIDFVTINQTFMTNSGLMKRRRWGRGWIIVIGNVYLNLSHSRIRMFPSASAWQTWECHSYDVLYGGGCSPMGSDALIIQPLPGQSLLAHLQAQTLTPLMMVAAAHEFRRAHQLSWTHGDPHLANILYDETRASLIDFETQHDPSVPFHACCADDLLVVLLDVMGRVSSAEWLSLSRALLSAYEDKAVLAALAERLYMPRGFELVLWKSRTQYLPHNQLVQRVTQLKQLVERLL